jgi:hypothetical protein
MFSARSAGFGAAPFADGFVRKRWLRVCCAHAHPVCVRNTLSRASKINKLLLTMLLVSPASLETVPRVCVALRAERSHGAATIGAAVHAARREVEAETAKMKAAQAGGCESAKQTASTTTRPAARRCTGAVRAKTAVTLNGKQPQERLHVKDTFRASILTSTSASPVRVSQRQRRRNRRHHRRKKTSPPPPSPPPPPPPPPPPAIRGGRKTPRKPVSVAADAATAGGSPR